MREERREKSKKRSILADIYVCTSEPFIFADMNIGQNLRIFRSEEEFVFETRFVFDRLCSLEYLTIVFIELGVAAWTHLLSNCALSAHRVSFIGSL